MDKNKGKKIDKELVNTIHIKYRDEIVKLVSKSVKKKINKIMDITKEFENIDYGIISLSRYFTKCGNYLITGKEFFELLTDILVKSIEEFEETLDVYSFPIQIELSEKDKVCRIFKIELGKYLDHKTFYSFDTIIEDNEKQLLFHLVKDKLETKGVKLEAIEELKEYLEKKGIDVENDKKGLKEYLVNLFESYKSELIKNKKVRR